VGWLGLITGLIKLASVLADIAARRQLIKAGEAQAIAAGNQRTLDDLAKIQASRVALDDPGSGRAERVRDRFTRPE
jgi:hypothetical protein